MLNRTGLLPRRRAGLLALCGAAAVGVAYAVQASPAAAIPAEGYVRLSLSLSFQEGMTIHRTNINLIGRSGEPMRIAMRPQMSGAPDLAINLKATALDDDQFRLDVTPEGLPPTHTGSRGMTARWGDAATLDSFDAAENTRFTVFAVGTRSAGPLPGRLQ